MRKTYDESAIAVEDEGLVSRKRREISGRGHCKESLRVSTRCDAGYCAKLLQKLFIYAQPVAAAPYSAARSTMTRDVYR